MAKLAFGRCLISMVAIFTAVDANAACTRHIYNKSSQNWTFQAFPAPIITGPFGNVWFSSPSCNSKNGPCVVKPGEIAAIKYTTVDGQAKGQMRATDSTGRSKVTEYLGAFSCPAARIVNAAWSAGAVKANTPKGGDYTVVKDKW